MNKIEIQCYWNEIKDYLKALEQTFAWKIWDILVNVNVDKENTLTIVWKDLILRTATWWKILVKDSLDQDVIVWIWYSFVKKVTKDNVDIWLNNKENEK